MLIQLRDGLATLLDILDQGDLCATVMLIGVLFFFGSKLVTIGSAACRWGLYLALAAFLAYGVYGCVTIQPATAEEFLGIVFRSFLAGGLTLGPARILLAILSFLHRRTLGPGLGGMRRAMTRLRLSAHERNARRQQEEHDRLAQSAFDRTAPERERARQEAEVRASALVLAQRRREDARTRCVFFFALHGPEIGARFTKEMFDDSVAKYMGDHHPPEYVEERGQQLESLMQQHLAKTGHASHQLDIVELTTAYERQCEQIRAFKLDERLKTTLLTNLLIQFTSRIMRQTEE